MNTRKATVVSVAMTIYVIQGLFRIVDLPLIDVVLGLLVPLLGWRDTVLFRTILYFLVGTIMQFNKLYLLYTLLGFEGFVVVEVGIWVVHLTTIYVSNRLLCNRLII